MDNFGKKKFKSEYHGFVSEHYPIVKEEGDTSRDVLFKIGELWKQKKNTNPQIEK